MCARPSIWYSHVLRCAYYCVCAFLFLFLWDVFSLFLCTRARFSRGGANASTSSPEVPPVFRSMHFSGTGRAVLCCAMLCCAVLCYAVLCSRYYCRLDTQRHARTHNEKKEKKNREESKESKEIQEGSPTNNILVGNCRLRRAESWENMPRVSSESRRDLIKSKLENCRAFNSVVSSCTFLRIGSVR